MSEQHSEPTSGETGSIGTGPAAPDMSQPKEPVTATAPIESPHLALDQEGTSKPDAPRETTKVELPKAEVTGVETTRVDATRTEPPPIPGKLLVMSPGDRAWNGQDAAEKSEAAGEASSGKRRMSAMAAAVALATIAGAVGGALATTGFGYLMGRNPAVANASALESQVARIDADIVALKASVEHTSKMGMSQFNKTSDRLDKVEKAQAEPAVKLARLSEAVDKLRAQPAPAVVAVAPGATAVTPAAKEVTGSIAPAAAAAATPVPLPAPKPEIARLPTVDGWVIRDVGRGGALIESRRGIFEVYAGDSIPGLGSIDAIRRQDGKWVVVTSKGLIVAR